MNLDSLEDDDAPTPMCCVVVCQQPAAGKGPHSRQPMCLSHLAGDVEVVRGLERNILTKLQPYAAVSLESIEDKERLFNSEIQSVSETFSDIRECLTECETRIRQRLQEAKEAAKMCAQTRQDIQDFENELAQANAAGDVAEVCGTVLAMELSLNDLRDDFRRFEELPTNSGIRVLSDGVQELLISTKKRMQMLNERTEAIVKARVGTGSIGNRDAAGGELGNGQTIIVGPSTQVIRNRDSGNLLFATSSSEIKLESWVILVTSCSDTRGFCCDSSGRVVPAESAGDDCVPLPQPALFAVLHDSKVDHLVVTSVDGAQMFKCFCPVNFQSSICGLECLGQQLLIAQADAVTVADLSGRVLRTIKSDVFGAEAAGITGIGGSADKFYVSSGSRIAAVSAATGAVEKILEFPDCDMRNLVVFGNRLLALGDAQLHSISIGSGKILATYQTQSAGFPSFDDLVCVAADSKGRIFVSDGAAHAVYALADDGTLLGVSGAPGERGNGADRLNYPHGLAVVTGSAGSRDQLVVADRGNKRLLLFE